MFCTSIDCGTEVASSYKICPKCGGKSFGPKQLKPSAHVATNQTMAGLSPQGVGGNASKSIQKTFLLMIVGIVVFISLAVVGYKYLKDAELKAEIHKQEEMARIEIERKQREMELEIQRKKREEETAREIERKRQAEKDAQIQAEQELKSRAERESAQQRRQNERASVDAMEVGFRKSIMQKDTMVLAIRNIKDTGVEFDLQCCTTSNSCKTLFVSVEGRHTTEIGWLEGWAFTSGERCVAKYQGEKLWSVLAP